VADTPAGSEPHSDPVRDFYTRHPYPPPVENLDRAREEWRDPNRRRAEFHLFWPERQYRADLDILVAGCGTWQAAKYAICRPEARVVGIDVSATSIEHTARLKQKYGLANLELRLLPIEQVGELERDFDLIVSTGVLHHLADPDAGLRALRSVLRPDGAIYLMVYAPFGRAGAYMLQEYCRRLGIGTSDQEIHDLIATLDALPQQHPLATLLRGSRDARDAGALADLLLNPRDRAYSVPQLLDFADRNDLTLRRWYWQAPYLPQCGAIGKTPHAARLAALPAAEQYAAVELWRGTMTAHSAVLCRSDANQRDGNPRFDDRRDWPHYVPIRLPWTQLVEERLPPGAAAVALNRSHPHHDLVLVLGATEKRLFQAIDGHRSIGEISAHAAATNPDLPRVFFEKLWWYDQVVFDMSRAE
jgi:SAM-dependent methyltransferase